MIKILGVEFECICAYSTLWFSQKETAKIFQATKQNISLHTLDLGYGDSGSISKRFPITQVEGNRRIRRSMVHYDIGVVAAIALRSRRYDIHEELLKVASDHRVELTQIPIRLKKEWEFGELLIGALCGITQVMEQHQLGIFYADFYLPEFKLVVEFDELHHTRPKRSALDAARQAQMEKVFGVSFIRIKQGEEVHGLNKILKSIFNQFGPNHSMQPTVPLRGPAADFDHSIVTPLIPPS